MRGIVGDGRAFIDQTREPYDMIVLDAFGSDSVPPSLTTQEFLRAVHRAVRPDGVVVGNIWDRRSNSLYDSMVRTYQEIFADLYVLPVSEAGNVILLALPRRENLERDTLAKKAGRISAAKGFRFDLAAQVQPGFLHATEKAAAGRVLRDVDLPRP